MSTAAIGAPETSSAGRNAGVRRTGARAAGALIVGGAHGSLGVIRSLGRHGIPVWVLTGDHPIARFSRYARRSFSWPGPDDPGALNYLLDLADRGDLLDWVLFPGGDAEARFIALNHKTLRNVFRLTTPPWETLQWAAEKSCTYQLAADIGVDCPWTLRPQSREELEHLDCQFPVILKPSARNSTNPFTHAKAWRIDDRASLLARYEEAAEMVGADSVLLQELIPGNGSAQFSFAAVCKDGIPLACLTARRSRQYPIDFGYTSTFVESIEQPEVERAARRFLKATRYSGLVELEFKYDHRDDRFKLLDVNARTWAWVSLGSKAGVDFPWVMWQLALGQPVEPVRGRTGCAWAHVLRDVAAAAAEIRAGSLTVSKYWQSMHSSLVFAAFSPDDPMPGFMDLPLTVWRMLFR
jgi:D-aspartate ligase